MVRLPFAFFHSWHIGVQSHYLWTKDEKASGNDLQGSLRAEYWVVLHVTSLITLDLFHMGWVETERLWGEPRPNCLSGWPRTTAFGVAGPICLWVYPQPHWLWGRPRPTLFGVIRPISPWV